MSGCGSTASSSNWPEAVYSEKYGWEPQPTNTLPFASGSRLPMYSASRLSLCGYCASSVAAWVLWLSLSTSPRERPVGDTYVPPPVIWQQWSSNMLTVEFGYTATSCCHWKSAPE